MSSPLLVLERTVALSGALTAADLPHAVGGALALGYHVAEPRGTRDIDVNVTVDPEEPQPLFQALPGGVVWTEQDVRRAVRDGQVRLFWPVEGEHALPVDLFLPQHALHGVVAGRSELVPMLDAQVPVLSATDLTIFKALFDRARDWGDIEALLRYGEVDEAEVARWLVEVVGPDDPRSARFAELCRQVRQSGGDVPVAAVLFGRRAARRGERAPGE